MIDYPCLFCDGHHDRKLGLVTCVRTIADRVKELESKLGAASRRESATREDADAASVARPKALELSQATAPSVSAEYWSHLAARWEHAISCVDVGVDIPARYAVDEAKKLVFAYQLAAAVTEWYECDTPKRYSLSHAEDLIRIVVAFVRGEPLPQKGG